MSDSPADGPPRYRPLAHLGQGGFGAVSRDFDRLLRRQVARKTALRPTPWHRDQLLHEARLLAWLDHPGVVQVHDLSGTGEEDAVTLALVEGESLQVHLAARSERDQPMPVAEALRILRRLAETLANAHAKGVLHLDLKPANVVLQPFGRVVLLDWGAARFFDRAPYEAHLAAAGEPASLELPDVHAAAVSGTLAYMPPEQALGRPEELGPWTDVYAAGVVLHELLSGALPHEVDGDALAWAHARMTRPPRPLTELRADVPPSLSALCAHMLAPRPEERLASFEAVLVELDALSTPGMGRAPRRLQAGALLFAEGDPGDVAWQILAGRLEVFVQTEQGPQVLGTRGVGQLVGEVSLLTGEPRSASLRAAEDSEVRPVSREDIEAELAKVSPLVADMVRHLSLRLRESVAQVRGLEGSTGEVATTGREDTVVGGVIARLRRVDPAQAELAEAILVGGLGVEGAAALVGMEPEQARREWAMARALVRKAMKERRS